MTGPEVHVLAANGDHDAQLTLAHQMLVAGFNGDLPTKHAVTVCLVWGQMAATSGKTAHWLGYAGLILGLMGLAQVDPVHPGIYDDDFATALAIVDAVADAGHNRAEVISFALASRLAPAIIAKAMAIKGQVHVEPLTDEDRRQDSEGIVSIVEALRADTLGTC